MISGIHLATALSVMLHMEQEGSGMETKELIEALRQDSEMMSDGTREGLTKAWHDEVMKDSAKDCTFAADRLSEQQQVIDVLSDRLEFLSLSLSDHGFPDNGPMQVALTDALRRARDFTKEAGK